VSAAFKFRCDARSRVGDGRRTGERSSDLNSTARASFTANANAKMSSYTSIGVGAELYQMPPLPFVIWFDDLAIDDTQIHCQ
jgi:hypothetical protein